MTESIFWSYFSYRDIVDIAIAAFLIYQIIAVIKGTRAVQMLLGLGILAALFGLSIYYHLNAVNWMLSRFFDSFFILLIVLFQDPIRNALATFGTGRKFFQKKSTVTESMISEVTSAVSKLAVNKIGALIVFEKEHGLKSFMNTGSQLDSEVNGEMLFAIFESTSSLHDGAVIISEQRIASAGCFLPLSRNNELDKDFGTRHRASLGITEESDAIAVIVSEETGAIRIAHGGTFVKVESQTQLISELEALTKV